MKVNDKENLHASEPLFSNSRWLLLRHVDYFLTAIVILIVWSFTFLCAIIISLVWLSIEQGAFKEVWKEFWKFSVDTWTGKQYKK